VKLLRHANDKFPISNDRCWDDLGCFATTINVSFLVGFALVNIPYMVLFVHLIISLFTWHF
jgi:hypothetical protein